MAPTHPAPPLAEAAPTRPNRPPARTAAILVIVLLILALALVTLRLSWGDGAAERVAVPLGGRQTAVLQIDSGADSIVVSTGDLGSDLAVVTTPGGQQGGVRPKAHLDGDKLSVWTEDTGSAADGAQVQIDIRIAAGVRWDVLVTKGAKQVKLALGTGKVNAVELRGGADLADVTLPEPVGELAVRIPTGLATAALHLPDAVPAKVTFGSGAGRAVVDGAERQGIAAGISIYGVNGKAGKGGETGYTAAKNRVAVDVSAGVGALSLDRSRP